MDSRSVFWAKEVESGDPLPALICSLSVNSSDEKPGWYSFIRTNSLRHRRKGFFTGLEKLLALHTREEFSYIYLLWVKVRYLRLMHFFDDADSFIGEGIRKSAQCLSAAPEIGRELRFRFFQERYLIRKEQGETSEDDLLQWPQEFIIDPLYALRIRMLKDILHVQETELEGMPAYYRRKYLLLKHNHASAAATARRRGFELEQIFHEERPRMGMREEEDWLIALLPIWEKTSRWRENILFIRQLMHVRKRNYWSDPVGFRKELYRFLANAYEKGKKYKQASGAINCAIDLNTRLISGRAEQVEETFSCLLQRERVLEEIRQTQRQKQQDQFFYQDMEVEGLRQQLNPTEVTHTLDVLEGYIHSGQTQESVQWIQLFSRQIREALTPEGQPLLALQYEMEQFRYFIQWFTVINANNWQVEIHFTGEPDDELIDVPVSYLRMTLQELYVADSFPRKVSLSLLPGEDRLETIWCISPALPMDARRIKKLDKMCSVWGRKIKADIACVEQQQEDCSLVVLHWSLSTEKT